jgi:hypothetical protein
MFEHRGPVSLASKALRWRVGAVAFAAVTTVAIVSLVTACGSSSPSTPAAAATTPGGAGQQFAAYTQCLQRNGVTLATRGPRPSGATFSPRPRPSGSRGFGGGFGGGGFFGTQAPPGVDPATWQKAIQACASVRPSIGAGGNNSALVAYRNCLSNHGVTFNPGQPMNTADPKIAAALQTCAPLRPGRPTATANG